jgi:hypothetical protein
MTRRPNPRHPDNAEPDVDPYRPRHHRPSVAQLPRIGEARSLAQSERCPHCHADIGEPCRAGQGRGAELERYVHPARAAVIREREQSA